MRADYLPANFLFKGAQHSVIQKRAALYHDVLAQRIRRSTPDDLIQRIFYNADGKPGRNIFHGSAVLLCLLDGAVHKHCASRTEINWLFCQKPELGKFLHGIAHYLRKGLQKRAAAGGTGLV